MSEIQAAIADLQDQIQDLELLESIQEPIGAFLNKSLPRQNWDDGFLENNYTLVFNSDSESIQIEVEYQSGSIRLCFSDNSVEDVSVGESIGETIGGMMTVIIRHVYKPGE